MTGVLFFFATLAAVPLAAAIGILAFARLYPW